MNKYAKFASEAMKFLLIDKFEFDCDIDTIGNAEEYTCVEIQTGKDVYKYKFKTNTAGLLMLASVKANGTMRGVFSKGAHACGGGYLIGRDDIREFCARHFDKHDYAIIRYIETGDNDYLEDLKPSTRRSYESVWDGISTYDAPKRILTAMIDHGEDWYKKLKK